MPDLDDMDEVKKENFVKMWLGRIDNALKREKKYRQLGNHVINLYEAKTPEKTPFAIVYSNTETLQPALYNQRPIPIVTRRFKDPDPVGKAVADVSTRVLKFLIDTEDEEYDPYDDLTQAAVLESCLVNRGVTRFKYVPHEGGYTSECVYGESVRWDKFFHGYARSWKKVQWIGFEWDMTADEIRDNFGKTINLRDLEVTDETSGDEGKSENRDELAGVKTFKVYEIWDKKSKRVMFFSGSYRKEPLRLADDPLGLSGFFPVPRPINLMRKVSSLLPTPLYEQYKQQAAELNDLTNRIKAIIKAVRYRGAYNSTVEGIEKLLDAEDNELVPVENLQSMPDNTTMDKLLYVVPVNELVQTVQTLYQQREQCKQVIYEITGISDILRGASVASETATAQNIKNQWGTLRLKKMQKEVQRYCRDSLAIMLEIAAKKFEIETLQQMTGLPYLTNAQKAEAQSQIQLATQAAAQQAALSGQQPQPSQIPPEAQALLAAPSWEDIIGVLRNDVTRAYKTDIETNSTIDAEAAQDKQDISDLLNALSQFLNGIAPLVEQGVLPMGVAKEMLLVISRRYNFGTNLEDQLNAMTEPPKQQGPDPAQQAEQAAKAADAQARMQESQQKMALSKSEFEQKQALMAMQMQIEEQKLQIQREELDLQRQSIALKMASQKQAHDLKMETMRAAAKNKEVR